MRIAVALLLFAACGGDPEIEPDPFADLPAIDAAEYDCRASVAPPRASAVPLACFFDPDCGDLVVVGHRGSGGDFALYTPENSRSGIRLAMLLGADAVEIDVRDTLDGDLIVMHDGTTERTTAVDVEVGATGSAELQQIALAADGFTGDFACETVPRFDEILELVRGKLGLVVDTKTSRGDLVAGAIRDAGMIDQAVVSVSGPDVAVAARAAVPEIRIQLRPDTVAEYEEMAPLFDRPPEILEVPVDQLAAFAPIAASIGARLFADVFVEDATALANGDLAEYQPAIDGGAQTAQTEFSVFLLQHIGRRTWSTLPPHRDIGLVSPLLE